MKKLTALILTVLMALSLCACQSPLSRGIARSEKLYGSAELDLSAVLSEEEGFHHPDIAWNMTLEEIQKTTYASISEVLGASEAGEVSYEVSGMYKKILGRRNDSTVLLIDETGVCTLASIIFSTDDKESSRNIGLQDLFTQYTETLEETFGEPESSGEESRTIESAKVKYVTYCWAYETASGLLTELQWSAAYVSGSETPSYVTIGFALADPDAAAEADTEAEE